MRKLFMAAAYSIVGAILIGAGIISMKSNFPQGKVIIIGIIIMVVSMGIFYSYKQNINIKELILASTYSIVGAILIGAGIINWTSRGIVIIAGLIFIVASLVIFIRNFLNSDIENKELNFISNQSKNHSSKDDEQIKY